MKSIGRWLVACILGWQVRRLIRKNHVTTIGVVGSIGKTSTKLAIAETLTTYKSVQFQQGNYNDLVTVPLVFFGQKMPSLVNPIAWMKVFLRNEISLRKPYPFDIVVLELGTDSPGQIAAFKRYLHLDIAVITAITPEHMEYFADLDAVAKEELSVTQFAKQVIINAELVNTEYVQYVPNAITYALHQPADYMAQNVIYASSGVSFDLVLNGTTARATIPGFSEPHIYSALAAATVAKTINTDTEIVVKGLLAIKPVSGRMQRLAGIKNSVIVDDSYNASPEAMKTALDTIYRINAPQKIALLGNMNELGVFSPDAHSEIGAYCDARQLDQVITLGPEANKYLAPAARAKGCKVHEFESPYAAGNYIASIAEDNALILIKGSQNKVYAEEAIKVLLQNAEDNNLLVRQSSNWLAVKEKQFSVEKLN